MISSKNPAIEVARVVDQHVDAAEPVHGCLHRGLGAGGSVTSSRTVSRSSAAPTACATFSGSRPVATTAYPAARAAFAMSTPMPRPAPVIEQNLLLSHVARPPSSEHRVVSAHGAKDQEPVRSRGRGREEVAAGGCTDSPPLVRRIRPSLESVDNRDEVKAFLSSRRAKITPEQAGLTQLQPQPAGAGPAPQRGRRPGRGQRRVLRPARTRQPRRRLRQRPRRPRPRPAARRGRTAAPGRPGPRRRPRHPHPPQTRPPRRSGRAWPASSS